MALGYEGSVSLTHNSQSAAKADVECLATSTSGTYASNRLESTSGYGGEIDVFSTVASEVGVATPRTYDYPLFDGSFDFELNDSLADLIWENLIQQRQSRWEMKYKTRRGTIIFFDHNYWNSISLSASEGAFVTGSIGWTGLNYSDVITNGVTDNYCGNQFGKKSLVIGYDFDWEETEPLNPCGENRNPIPFWNSDPLIDDSSVPLCMEWSMNFSQDVVKFFKCENSSAAVDPLSDAPPPAFVACGPMTQTFDFTEMRGIGVSEQNSTRPDTLANAGAVGILMGDLDIISRSDNIPGQDALVPISYSYYGYTIDA